jgi:hypothetical protein
VALNCAAIPGTLLESELFGCERGAFTGAVNQTIGRFQRADRGTLFLDEIGDLPLELQPKLLRAVQEKQFERLGGGAMLQVDVRIIAATNQNLGRLVLERKFRADLFYRLNVFPMMLPPLRERREDTRANWRCGVSKPQLLCQERLLSTNHFAHAGVPADKQRLAEYEAGPYKGYGKKIQEAFAAIVPDDADVSAVAEAIAKVVDAPFGKRSFRVHIDPTQDGAEVAFGVIDRVRMEMLHRVRLDELLTPVKT